MLDLGMQILKGLAVVGGAAVGWLGCGFLLRLIVWLSLQRSTPRKVLVPIRALGGLTLGLAVWVWAFASGGRGPGLGGWFGSGQTGGPSASAPTEPGPTSTPATQPETARPPVPEPPLAQASDTLRIEILGGARVKDERFYLLEGEKEPRTLTELRKIIQARRQEPDKPPLRGIVILIYAASVARDHPAVKTLVKWAEGNGLSVTFPPPDGAAP
ncbi:MAG TPA: hypothetical protein VKU02_21515 [Gemmataceae bacterium]|nr:hypothetical protein [Gemmataceae bacterium]